MSKKFNKPSWKSQYEGDMDQEDDEVEEGEICDDFDDIYVPLERPDNFTASGSSTATALIDKNKDSASEEEIPSSSESDSEDGKKKSKRMKIRPKLKLNIHQKPKKYDVWSTKAQEDVLSETLNSCDVTQRDRSRDVESYIYQSNHHSRKKNNKRTREDRRNANFRQRKRSFSPEEADEEKGNPRIIEELSADCIKGTPEEIARDISNKLLEEKEELIVKVIKELGTERCLEVFEETRTIEKEGGMLIMNKTRRRTPGGVFLFLVRQHPDVSREQKENIFGSDRREFKASQKLKRKQKLQKMKQEIAASKAEALPPLLTRAEVLDSHLQPGQSRKSSDDSDVVNPPPTPETENVEGSGEDVATSPKFMPLNNEEDVRRKLEAYENDFLDLGSAHEMDTF